MRFSVVDMSTWLEFIGVPRGHWRSGLLYHACDSRAEPDGCAVPWPRTTGCRLILIIFMAPLCGTPSRRLEFLRLHSHLPEHPARPSRRGNGRMHMIMLHTHRGEAFGSSGPRSGGRFSAART